MAKSMLSSLIMESSMRICNATENFSPLLGADLDVSIATEDFQEKWDGVKERGTQIWEQLMRAINQLLVKIVEIIRKIKKENKGNFTCQQHVFDAAEKAVGLLKQTAGKVDTDAVTSDYEEVKKIREAARDSKTKKTTSVPASKVNTWLKDNTTLLKKLQAECKKAKREAITENWSTAQRQAKVKLIRQKIAICNAAYNLCAQVAIHGMKRERNED